MAILRYTWWDGSTWHDWETIGSIERGGPIVEIAAISLSPDIIDVYVRGGYGPLLHTHPKRI
jgi:hypothetical protein